MTKYVGIKFGSVGGREGGREGGGGQASVHKQPPAHHELWMVGRSETHFDHFQFPT